MKTIPVAITFCLFLFGCTNKSKEPGSGTATPVIAARYNYKQMEGTYTGDFGGTGDIRIVLRHVTGSNAVGYNLHKGLRRNMSGSMNEVKEGFSFDLQEPGDNPYDGTFQFTIDPATFILKGTWKPANNKSLTAKSYTLHKLAQTTDTAEAEAYDPMQVMYDSTGEFHFEPGGLCIYRFYTTREDSAATRQYEEIRGNWKKRDAEYIIDWQKNTLFPAQSHFKIVPYQEMEGGYYYLEGEGRKIEPQLAG